MKTKEKVVMESILVVQDEQGRPIMFIRKDAGNGGDPKFYTAKKASMGHVEQFLTLLATWGKDGEKMGTTGGQPWSATGLIGE